MQDRRDGTARDIFSRRRSSSSSFRSSRPSLVRRSPRAFPSISEIRPSPLSRTDLGSLWRGIVRSVVDVLDWPVEVAHHRSMCLQVPPGARPRPPHSPLSPRPPPSRRTAYYGVFIANRTKFRDAAVSLFVSAVPRRIVSRVKGGGEQGARYVRVGTARPGARLARRPNAACKGRSGVHRVARRSPLLLPRRAVMIHTMSKSVAADTDDRQYSSSFRVWEEVFYYTGPISGKRIVPDNSDFCVT